jgi:hypothetical protein
MRPIPSSLESKISQAFQTIHGNADPKMDIIAQKVQKYLTEGTFLQPRTIRTGDSLGPLDICIRREDVNSDPTEIVMAYIENGVAKVATLPYVHKPDENFTYQYTIGPAVDVACDFDGRWYRITERTGIYFDTSIIWALVTFGEPYFARVLPNGSLTIQQGNNPATSTTLADSNVTKCSLLRGWKNTYLWNHDQGIICAYIRNGKVCYRNYAQQPPDQPALWENEREITEFDTSVNPATNISLFRTNDYRSGFLAEINGVMYWLLTDRNWANMAIQDHHIQGTITDVKVELLPIIYTTAHHDHHLEGTITDVSCKLCPEIYPQVIDISNPGPEDAECILIECDLDLYGDLIGLESAFIVTDSNATPYAVSATAKGLTDNIIMLTVANFESASGNLTVKYTHATAPIYAQVEGGCFMELFDFSESFTPDIQPPVGYADSHLQGTVKDVTVNLLPVTYIGAVHNNSLLGTITDVTVTLIHIDDINP